MVALAWKIKVRYSIYVMARVSIVSERGSVQDLLKFTMHLSGAGVDRQNIILVTEIHHSISALSIPENSDNRPWASSKGFFGGLIFGGAYFQRGLLLEGSGGSCSSKNIESRNHGYSKHVGEHGRVEEGREGVQWRSRIRFGAFGCR